MECVCACITPCRSKVCLQFSTGPCPLHQTLGNLWISSFSKSFWVSGCVTQRVQWVQPACCVYVVSVMCSVCRSFQGQGWDGDRREARPAVTSSERQTNSGEADCSQRYRTLRVLFFIDFLCRWQYFLSICLILFCSIYSNLIQHSAQSHMTKQCVAGANLFSPECFVCSCARRELEKKKKTIVLFVGQLYLNLKLRV